MYAKQVKQFVHAAEPSLPQSPQPLGEKQLAFITRMVQDELRELQRASNLVEQADAMVDLIYYLLHTALKNGIDLDPIFEIVHAANMQKVVGGKVRRRADGKILKPDHWQSPEPLIAQALKQQPPLFP